MAYQATFDTVAGDFTTVRIPWHEFVPVKRAKWDPTGAPLDPSAITNIGLVLSRFEFNGMPNPNFSIGTCHAPLFSTPLCHIAFCTYKLIANCHTGRKLLLTGIIRGWTLQPCIVKSD